MRDMPEFRLGCAVWSYRGWLGGFYPAGSASQKFLKLYGDRLHAVEGNTTFYAMPSAETVQRWREETPPEFRFCLKFPQTVTHQGLLMDQIEGAKVFIERVQPLGDRLSCIFAQLPPYYSPNYFSDCQQFLGSLAHFPVQLGIEVRHPQWFTEPHYSALNDLLREYKVAKILLDTRPIYNCPDDPQAQSQRKKPKLPLIPSVTNHQAIVRFISHPTKERNYTYLNEWVIQIQQWLSAGISVYFFMHCPIEDHSPDHLLYFQTLLQQANIPVPPLPWQQITPEPEQLSLF